MKRGRDCPIEIPGPALVERDAPSGGSGGSRHSDFRSAHREDKSGPKGVYLFATDRRPTTSMPPALEEKRVSPTRQPRNHSSPLVTPSGRPLRMPGSASTASSGFAGAALASLASASSASRSSIATPDTSRSWCGDTSASFSAPPLVFGPALNGRSADKDALPAAQKASATQTSYVPLLRENNADPIADLPCTHLLLLQMRHPEHGQDTRVCQHQDTW